MCGKIVAKPRPMTGNFGHFKVYAPPGEVTMGGLDRYQQKRSSYHIQVQRLYCFHGPSEKTIVSVGISNQQFQGTILVSGH